MQLPRAPDTARGTQRLVLAAAGLVAAVVGATVLVPSLGLGLVSDDFHHLSREVGPELLLPRDDWYRYSPLGLALLVGMRAVFGIAALPYHVLCVGLHLVNAGLVFVLGGRLGGGRAGGALACATFLAFAYGYEPVFWTSAGVFYLPMTLFLLLACVADGGEWSLRRPVASQFAMLGCLAAALLFHEIALVGALVLPFLSVATAPRRGGAVRLVTRYGPLLLVCGAFLFVKHLGAEQIGSVRDVSARVGAATFVRAHLLAFAPFLGLHAASPFDNDMPLAVGAAGSVAAAALGLALLAGRSTRRLGCCLVLFQLAVLPVSASSMVIEARYLYLPGAFSSLLVGLLVAGLLERRALPRGARPAILLAWVAAIAWHVDFQRTRVADWRRGARIVETVVRGVAERWARADPRPPGGLVVLNLPDYLPGTGVEDEWPAHLFANVFPLALDLELRYGGLGASSPAPEYVAVAHTTSWIRVAGHAKPVPTVRMQAEEESQGVMTYDRLSAWGHSPLALYFDGDEVSVGDVAALEPGREPRGASDDPSAGTNLFWSSPWSLTNRQVLDLFRELAEGQVHDFETWFRYDADLDRMFHLDPWPVESFRLRTNAQGLREDGDASAEPPDLRVLVAGDGLTEGMCVNAESYPNLLEALLVRADPERSVEVLNAGLRGYTLFNHQGALRRHLDLRPDVFVVTLNGADDPWQMLAPARYLRGEPALARCEDCATNLARIAQEAGERAVEAARAGPLQAAHFRAHPDDRQVASRSAIDLLLRTREVCEEFGVRMVLAYVPPPLGAQRAPFGALFEQVEEILELSPEDADPGGEWADQVFAWCAEQGVETLDLRPDFAEREEGLFWLDGRDLSTAGRSHVAWRLGEALGE